MKKLAVKLLVAAMLLVSLAGCAQKPEGDNQEATQEKPESISQGNSENSGKKIKIGIVQPVEHPSLNEIREYITLGLEEQGLKDKVEITYKDAQGDDSNIKTIISQFVGDKMDMIVPIGTGTAQAAAAATKDIPIVFAAVSYPVEAGLANESNVPDGNITGVSDALSVTEIFALAKILTPDVETFGFVYDSGQPNSIVAIEEAKKYCDANGLKYVEATIANSSELLQAAQSMAGKADAIFTPTDNTVASAMPSLAAEAIKAKIPVYVGADSMVADGGFATVGVDYKVLGRQVAAMIKRIVDGESIKENPVETLTDYSKIVNKTTAEGVGVELSEEKLEGFTFID